MKLNLSSNKLLLFDFGCVIVDLDKQRCVNALYKIGCGAIAGYVDEHRSEDLFHEIELGGKTEDFCDEARRQSAVTDENGVVHPCTASNEDIIWAWNELLTGISKEKLRFIIKTVGSGLAPFDSWLIHRGIKTLAIRMEKAQENAFAIVKYLQTEPKVKKIYYPGIEGTKGYEVCKRQARGFGSMLSFEVESAALAKHILKFTRLIPFAESLGGVETLLTYPYTQTHADVPEEIRKANGITESVLRMSVGIEAKEDLVNDLKEAISSYKG